MASSRLAAVLLWGLVAACSSPVASESPSVTTTLATVIPTPAASATPAPTLAPTPAITAPPIPTPQEGMRWSAATPLSGNAAPAELFVAVLGGDFVVVSPSREPGSRWLSADGISWDEGAVPGMRNLGFVWRVLVLADKLVVITLDEKKDHIQFWTSTDAVEWRKVPDEADFVFHKPGEEDAFGPLALMECCGQLTDARVENGTLIVEATPPFGDPCDICVPDPLLGVVRWTTADAIRWTREIVTPDYEFDGFNRPIATANGFIRRWQSDDEDSEGIEQSSDGSVWNVVWQTHGRVRALHAFSAGYLAVGYKPDGTILAASSVDGITWVESPGMQGWLKDFVETNGRIVAIGGTGEPFDPGVPSVWVSPPVN